MRFYWLRDRVQQGQFKVYWDSGKHSHGDYSAKHHSGAHHKLMRPIRLYIKDKSPTTSQGCNRIMTQNINNVSQALLAFHRRLALDQQNPATHKQQGDSRILLGPSTSGHMTTTSTRDILSTKSKTQGTSEWLTSYALTKNLGKQKPIIHSAKPGCKTAHQRLQPLHSKRHSQRPSRTHKLITTICYL